MKQYRSVWQRRFVAVAGVTLAGLVLLVYSGSAAPAPIKLKVGIVAAIDQLGVPVALDRGFFEKWGLDVTIATPYPTGVDQLNALQAGEIQMGQVGVPLIGAVVRGLDLVIVGNYSGSAVRLGGDDTMALVAREGSGIRTIRDLRGKRIGASFGTISHFYILGILEKAGLTTGDVTLVNVPPPETPVVLRGGAVDAFSAWDPWPVTALREIPGSYEVVRGGGFIGFVGFNVALRPWAERNQEVMERFLAARAEADKFMRAEPVKTAVVSTRWLTALRPEVALRGVRNNLPTIDIRISCFNYLALHNAVQTMHRLNLITSTFDVNKVFLPGPILTVIQRNPELFADLEPVPRFAQVGPGFTFKGSCP